MTVLLAADVGNSQTKLGWFEEVWAQHAAPLLGGETHFRTGGRTPARVIAALLMRVPLKPAAAVMCSVVPDATDAWRDALGHACGCEPLVVSGDSDVGMANHYAEPASLGADRLVAALAARHMHGAPVIVVNLGTATVVDAVSREGEFLGGAIAPGVETSLAALAQKAARLPALRPRVVRRAIATDTESAILAGAFFGAIGQVRELVARMRSEMGENAPAVLTGGWARLVARHLDGIAGVEPALTLIGLRLAWEHAAHAGG